MVLAAGLAIDASLVAEGILYVRTPDTTWRPLVVGRGYPVGFLIVVLGRMQFFTESTITAMLAMVDGPVSAGVVAVPQIVAEHDMPATFWTAAPASVMIAGFAWMLSNAREASFLPILAVTYVVGVAVVGNRMRGAFVFAVLAQRQVRQQMT